MSVEINTPPRSRYEYIDLYGGEENTGITSINREKNSCSDKFINDLHSHSADEFSNLKGKRRFSQCGGYHSHWTHKRRRHSMKGEKRNFAFPSHFLFGGDINDPLNLKGLCDSELGKILNEVTPHSSPLPAPKHRLQVDVMIPQNSKDPLNLASSTSNIRKKKRRRHKTGTDSHFVSSAGDESTEELTNEQIIQKQDRIADNQNEALKIANSSRDASDESKDELDSVVDKNLINLSKLDSIQLPSRKRKRSRYKTSDEDSFKSTDTSTSSINLDINLSTCSASSDRVYSKQDITKSAVEINSNTTSGVNKPIESQRDYTVSDSKSQTVEFSKQPSYISKDNFTKSKISLPIKSKFMYGNYDRYYGYRCLKGQGDLRLNCLRSEWFYNKRVLDIGCNVGHVTLYIAYHYKPSKIIGMDIDGKLIDAARKNIRHYTQGMSGKYPSSLCLDRGPLGSSPKLDESSNFPSNTIFIQGNYVLDNDALLSKQLEEYDVVLALSVTKWIHLNWGDDGLKRFFRRIFKQLKPGGILILEPQPFSSYGRRKKLTETTYQNYYNIKFKPQHFRNFLLSDEVGFKHFQLLDIPNNQSKGFQRPLELYSKAELTKADAINVSQNLEHESVAHHRGTPLDSDNVISSDKT